MSKKILLKLLNLVGIAFLIAFVSTVLLVSVRGLEGNPTSKELLSKKWMENGPLELSPERGRFALLYTVVEEKSVVFSLDTARYVTPDLGTANGKFVSLFAPLVSFVSIPGYLIGKSIGLSQVGGFATIALFALFNVMLLRAVSIRLGANPVAATIASLTFIFASPAFSYAVTLYQHHISTFLILSSIYLLVRWKNWLSLSMVWLLFAASIPVDYPNLILMFPIALYATTRVINFEKLESKYKFKLKFFRVFTPIAMLIPLIFYVWFSQESYGKPFQLSGTVKSVRAIDAQGNPYDPDEVSSNNFSIESEEEKAQEVAGKKDKNAVGFFKTRNLLNGLTIHFLSPDRGIIYYTPVVLLGFLGLLVGIKKKTEMVPVLIGVIGANVLLYSMWGDPWGGWAFGSRYLIPSYAMLSIFIALLLTHLSKRKILNVIFILFFLVVSIYSISVNTLGAVTTNLIPPKGEAKLLETFTNRVEKYSYDRNIDFVKTSGSKSFVYQKYLVKEITPLVFYQILTISISSVFSLITLYYLFTLLRKGNRNV